jgi:hypothetical protein
VLFCGVASRLQKEWGLRPELIGPQSNIVVDQSVNASITCPIQPVASVGAELHMQSMDQYRGEWLHNRCIFCAVPCPNHNSAFRELILTDAAIAISRFANANRNPKTTIRCAIAYQATKTTTSPSRCTLNTDTSRTHPHALSLLGYLYQLDGINERYRCD